MVPNRSLFALVAAALLVTSVFAPGLAGAATTAGNTSLTVTTDDATSVTNTSAELNGNLTDLGTAEDINVSFQYWVEGDRENRTTVDVETLNETGTFSTAVDGLENNTTYVYIARAEANGTVLAGDHVTFTAGAAGDDGFEMVDGPFGQNVARFVDYLKSSGDLEERNLGQAVSKWVTENNPGADNRPDHAGPPEDRGPDAADDEEEEEEDDKRRGPPGDKERGPPEDRGPDAADDDEKDEDDEDDEDDTDAGEQAEA